MDKGGEVHATSAGCVACDSRQIGYWQEKYGKDPNPLYSIMLECKLLQGKQDVKSAPQPMCVVFQMVAQWYGTWFNKQSTVWCAHSWHHL